MSRSLEELQQVDDRTLRFTPYGLGISRVMTPDGSAQYLQDVVDHLDLAADVAEGTRSSFDRLKTVFVQGLFCYDLFTLVNDHALLVVEQALRDRFVDYHAGTVRFVDAHDIEHLVAVNRYDDVFTAIKNKRWRVAVAGGQPVPFNGMLGGLRDWARATGLLRGQRNRGIERALSALRNFVAHPTSYHLVDPWHALRTLSDLAEIINHLWNHPTPGGRLYPAPIRREVVALAWTDDREFTAALADAVHDAVDPADRTWRYAIVRAVFQPDTMSADPGLSNFDSRYEVTRFPADTLWGPGTLAEAKEWSTQQSPAGDESDYLDRIFLIRHDGDQLYLPMRPTIAATLPAVDLAGTWYVARADFPDDAYHHVRTLISGGDCLAEGECPRCPAHTLAIGSYADIGAHIPNPASTAALPDFRIDSAASRSRSVSPNAP